MVTGEVLSLNFEPVRRRLDRAAIWLSGICLVHCLAIPFAVLALPVIGDHLLDSETMVHWLLLAPAVPVSIVSLWSGYRRHDYPIGLLIGACGLSLMFIGVSHLIDRSYEIPLTIAGATLVTIAHGLNMRRLRSRD
ncbi:MAG: MerC domain-containing protein [Gammaproteobacteria bacterium]|nr:MerC domain-containing protein [Gammaproteobacteria bacterium]